MNEENSAQRSRKALWFTLVPLAMTLVLLVAIALKQRMFVASDRLFSFSESGAGIAIGMPIKMQGFVIGSVREIALVPPDDGAPPKVRLTLDVSRDAMRYIGTDSSVRLVQEGLIGQAILEIAHGKGRARHAAHGDVLAFERGRALSDIATELSVRAQPVLDNLQKLTGQLSDPAGDFALTMKGAQQVMARTDETMATIGNRAAATLDTTGTLLQRVERTVPKVDGLLDTTDSILRHVEKTLPKVDGLLDQALDVSLTAKGTISSAQSLVDGGGQVVEDVGKVTKGAMRSWPFSSWSPPATAQTLAIDSQDNAPAFIEPARDKVAK
jgi:phospholipid/cholesterol/gamma-HCH transport system substrate-binding protein